MFDTYVRWSVYTLLNLLKKTPGKNKLIYYFLNNILMLEVRVTLIYIYVEEKKSVFTLKKLFPIK